MFSVVKLASETLTENYSPNLFNHFYETSPEGFWVAEKLQKIIGFIVGIKTNNDTSRIVMLAISDKQRKQGLGAALLKNFIREMTSQNIKQIELEVKTDNKKAINFYNKHGFNIIDTIQRFYQNGEDAYIMRQVF